jgi:Ca2+-binding EF-hand superfamily protein
MQYTGIPIPTKKLENRQKFGRNTETELTEWEKNQIKPLFKEFDKDKKGIQKEKLATIIARLASDDCCIGKVPNLALD